MTATLTLAETTAPCARPTVLTVFLNGAPQITTDERFTRHQHADGAINWDGILAEPGWSTGQRILIKLAAALTGNQHLPPDNLSAHLTRQQTDLVLAMCRTARL
ncbi:hypothetical protein ABH920_001433 [Catenulispora sp. EB89]|uniref:hypothetical protein n=1 Tax=Catenulispora sp. EB89 TaxID=3156257 RepID=UPI0035130E2A